MVGTGALFWSFLKIGTFTIGGGFAMIPLMQKEIVERRAWLSQKDFLDLMSVSQAMPGIFAVNMASSIGYRKGGLKGAICAVLGNIIVPILIILAWAIFFQLFEDNHLITSIFRGIRPAVVALIAAPVFSLAKTAKISWRNAWIPITSAALIWILGISPIFIILAAIAGGYIWSFFTKN